MSDSEHSSVTYTSVPNPVDDYSDIGSPEVDGPPSPDYVPGPEEPEQAPPSHFYLPYVPKLVYPKYMPPEDDVFPAEEQPLPVAATPTADSPGYIPEFDLKGDLEEDDEEDPEEDPADYPADSTVVALPAVDHVLSEEVTEPLLQIPSPPLPIPSPPPNSPTHIEIPESCLPLQKRLRFASPTPSQEVEESSAAGAARQDEPAVVRDDPYSLVKSFMDLSIRSLFRCDPILGLLQIGIKSQDIIMSDSEHSSVTYTSVPSPIEDYSNIGSPEVDGPPSPDYVPGPKEPEQAPPSPVYLPYVLELVYPEYMPPEDDVFPAEEQPLLVAATPTADSPGYILEFDPKGDPQEDDEEDPEEDHADYPADSIVIALPAIDHVPSEEVTKPLPQIPSPPLPITSPPLNIPTHIEIPESCLPLRKMLHFASPIPSQEVGESSVVSAARQDEPAVARDDPYSLVREELYGFFDRDELVGASEEIAPTILHGINQRVTNLSTMVEQETTIMYGIMEDAQDDRRQGVIKELLAADHKRRVQLTKALSLLGIIGYSQLADCIDLLFCLATQYRSFVQKMEPKRTTRLTPVITTPTTSVTNAQLQAMIDQGVTTALAARDANSNGDDSHTSGTVACQVKFATCTLQGNALTWWNSHVKTTTPEATHAMPWRTLKKMMTDKYCPRSEIKKL
nr:hypothetical protein [Tanacetum cinerariifolium]